MNPQPFDPCSPRCPLLTGEPFGSLRYCPMQDRARHHSVPSNTGSFSKIQGRWHEYDWRTDTWVPGEIGRPRVPAHPDLTDCCANFQCCSE